MKETRFCQSCAMPMGITDEHYGSDADGGKSEDYCGYCYKDGSFTKELTMNEMLEICVGFMKDDDVTEKEARKTLKKLLPTLKRWKVNKADED